MIFVLDACAIIAHVDGEEGAEYMEGVLLDSSNTFIIHALNLCEIYLHFLRKAGQAYAQAVCKDIGRAGIRVVDTLPPAQWMDAAQLKAQFKGIALADCICLALARSQSATVLTADHKEMGPVQIAGACAIQFIRPKLNSNNL